MILYKYTDFKSGTEILKNCSIGFSQPEYFNDPFDHPVTPSEDPAEGAEGIFASFRPTTKDIIWNNNTGILSLTRTPANPLMWAHYAEKHRGLVIGIDAIAAGFTDEGTNFIPAQFGSMIYLSQRSKLTWIRKPRTPLGVGKTHSFHHDHFDQLQSLFLHKSICWSYEEEVRILKCINGLTDETPKNPSGEFTIIQVEDHPLYLYSLPPEAIKEVYFGIRTDDQKSDDLYYSIKQRYPDAMIYECNLEDNSLTVGFDRYVTIAEATSY